MKKITVRDIVIISLMAAMVFATTYFIKIEIPTPAGVTMLKAGNILCLLSALLFGKWKGALSAGIGSMFFDLLNPLYLTSAPYTLLFFGIMAYVCGKIAYLNNANGKNNFQNIIACIIAVVTYITLHISKTIIVLMLAGSAFVPAIIASIPKIITSSINGIIAVVGAVVLSTILRKSLEKNQIIPK